MKTFILFFLLLSVAAAEQVKLKYSQLVDLASALRSLDGYPKVIDQGKEPAKVLTVPFDFRATARMAIARDLVAVVAALDAFETSRQKALQTASPGAPEKVATSPELLAKFLELWNKEIGEPVTIDLALLSEESLNLEANTNITGTALAGLTPVIASKK